VFDLDYKVFSRLITLDFALSFLSSHGLGFSSFKGYLIVKLPRQAPIFLIVDGLDECPNTSALSSPRQKVLILFERPRRLTTPELAYMRN